MVHDQVSNTSVEAIILDTLQVQLVTDSSIERNKQVALLDWHIVGFDPKSIIVKLVFENADEIGLFEAKDDLEITFFGSHYFKSSAGVHVGFGERLTYRV